MSAFMSKHIFSHLLYHTGIWKYNTNTHTYIQQYWSTDSSAHWYGHLLTILSCSLIFYFYFRKDPQCVHTHKIHTSTHTYTCTHIHTQTHTQKRIQHTYTLTYYKDKTKRQLQVVDNYFCDIVFLVLTWLLSSSRTSTPIMTNRWRWRASPPASHHKASAAAAHEWLSDSAHFAAGRSCQKRWSAQSAGWLHAHATTPALPPAQGHTDTLLPASQNNNNNNNRIQRRYSRFFTSPHSAAKCLQHVRSSSPGAIVCKSRATHRALIRCKCHVACHLVRRDSSAIKFDELKSHLFELYFIGWTIKPMNSGFLSLHFHSREAHWSMDLWLQCSLL